MQENYIDLNKSPVNRIVFNQFDASLDKTDDENSENDFVRMLE